MTTTYASNVTPPNTMFVYGTLKPDSKRFEHIDEYVNADPLKAVVKDHVMICSETTDYPLLVPKEGATSVIGYLLTFKPNDFMPWLITAKIEGFDPLSPDSAYFVPTKVKVLYDDKEVETTAWVAEPSVAEWLLEQLESDEKFSTANYWQD